MPDIYDKFEAVAKELKILLAEDEESVFAVEREMLSMFFNKIDHAKNGQIALEMYKKNKYDLVLSDVNMPVMSGVELVRTIKELNKEQTVVMVSAQNDAETLFELINIGVDSFILKPFRVENAINSLYKICKNIDDARNSRNQISMLLSAIEQSPEVIIITDPSGIIEYVNPVFSAISGFGIDEVFGKNASMFKSGLQSEEFYQHIWNLISNKKIWSGEFVNKKKNGEICYLKASIAPVFDPLGNIAHFVAVVQNITDFKKLQQDLVQAQKLESVGQLAAGIAHEINTPVQYIGDNIRFLHQATDSLIEIIDQVSEMVNIFDNASKEHTEKCQMLKSKLANSDIGFFKDEIPLSIKQSLEGVEHISKIVKAMKEFAHPGGADKGAMNINRILENVIIISRNEWKYAADIQTNLEESLPQVGGYANEISQVLLNMIINSAQALNEKYDSGNSGKGLIYITTKSLDKEITITIKDTGTGIPEHLRTKIYDPFFTTKDVGKGTGQGLYLAHDIIVNKHKGTIELNSLEGEWTEFVIHLPKD